MPVCCCRRALSSKCLQVLGIKVHPLLAVEAGAGLDELKAKSDLLLGMGSLFFLVLLPYCTRLILVELRLKPLSACVHAWL